MKISQATYLDQHKIRLKFNDGLVTIVDFANFLQAKEYYLKDIKSIKNFKRVRVMKGGAGLIWPKGWRIEAESAYLLALSNTDMHGVEIHHNAGEEWYRNLRLLQAQYH